MAQNSRPLTDAELSELIAKMSDETRERLLKALAKYLYDQERREEYLRKLRDIK